MVILRDDKRIERLRKIGQYTSLTGFILLIGALILGFVNPERFLFLQVLALPVGWLLSQVGLYLSHRYLRSPRPDEVLDETLEKVARDGRMYHYLLPAPHVLLTPAGPVVFIAKFQPGDISVTGEKWKQKGVGIMRRFFGQEGLGNPTREADSAVAALAKYIDEHAPEVEEVPIGVAIVFTTKHGGELDLDDSRIPAMHATKLAGYFKQNMKNRPPLPEAEYKALRQAFDKKAAHLLDGA